MKNRIIDSMAEVAGMLLEGLLLTLPLTGVVVCGSVMIGILHLCK